MAEPAVGLLVLGLRIEGARTLKDRRAVVKAVLDRVAARFRVSIAELGPPFSPRDAVLAATHVANDYAHVQQRLETVARFVEANFPVEIVEHRLERL